MLTGSALGMALYGLYSAGLGVADVFGIVGLDWWADLALVALGLLLTLSAAFVRVRMPGGLALAMASLHNDTHFYGQVLVVPQVIRAVVAVTLVGLAMAGSRKEQEDGQAPPQS